MRARSILNRRAQTTGSTHNFKEIVQMCAKNFAHIKKNTTNVVFFSGAADDKERRGDCLQEETPSAGDERSARL